MSTGRFHENGLTILHTDQPKAGYEYRPCLDHRLPAHCPVCGAGYTSRTEALDCCVKLGERGKV